ncbi:MAG: CDP-glucose 4,6-dehydratase [Lachnospiraceae bacterium]|nr:CDP-glucose 4,6-dehydratase [Lachnospiraceae bacterium]
MNFDLNAYRGKTVFVTGHTGFKGSWLSVMLVNAGARVVGYSTCAKTEKRLFDLCGVREQMTHIRGDVRDLDHLTAAMAEAKPEIVLHLAAQPIVRDSYLDPVGTYATNVMGTVNLLEAVRHTPSVLSVLNVTTDKVYRNREWAWGYRENEELDGYDPYSNSKSCSELVTHCYKRSFLDALGIPVSTARAGNVIGGGDYQKDRIVPDCVRAAEAGEPIILRNPNSVRPYQHVLEPLFVYLTIAAAQAEDKSLAGGYNVGPDLSDCLTTGELADLFCRFAGSGLTRKSLNDNGPHEAGFLRLDNTKLKKTFGWKPVWNAEEAIRRTVEYMRAADKGACMDQQIREFLEKERGL